MKKLILSLLFSLVALVSVAQHQYTKWVPTSGTDTYTATITVPTFPATYTGTIIYLKFGNTNTGASTINVNSDGAANIRKWNGSAWVALSGSEIDVNTIYKLSYSGSYYEMESFGSATSGTVTSVSSANGDATIANPTTTPAITIVSAPKLTTARTINGTSFDGTGNVTVTAAAGTLTGTTLASNVVTTSVTTVGALISGSLASGFTPVTVPLGGTGVASLTAYAPIFGGTTSTGAVQSGTVGTSGQVLTSNGAGALPTFQASNTLPSSVQGDIFYASGTNVIAALNKNASGTRVLSNQGTSNNPTWTPTSTGNAVTLTNTYIDLSGTGTPSTGAVDAWGVSALLHGVSSVAVGDLIQGATAANTFAVLPSVAAGSYLRSAGVTTASVWSTLILPNAATSTRVVFASATNTYGEDADMTFSGGNTLNVTQLNIGTGTTILKHLSASATLDFPSVASLGTQVLTITVTGAADGNVSFIGVPNGSMTAGLVFTSWVSATNTVSIQVYNSTLGAIDPASGTFRASVTQY